MSILTKVLRAGEGKKLKALTTLVPDINAFEREIEALSDADLQHKTVEFREQLDRARSSRLRARRRGRGGRRRPQRHPPGVLRRHPGGGPAGHRPAPLRRPAHGRGGPALRLDRGDEDRRGQDAGVDPARLPQRGERPGRPRHHRQRLPGPARRGVDGPDPSLAGPHRRHRPAHVRPARDEAPGLRGRRHLRHQQRVRLRLPARQHGHGARPDGAAGPRLRHRRRGRLHPHRRGPHPPHHQRPGAGRGRPLLQVRQHRPHPGPRRRLRGRRGEAHRLPPRGRHHQGRAGPGRRQPLRRAVGQLRPPAPGRPAGQGAVQARRRVRDPERRGQDRRRVHRPHPRRPALVGGPAPGGGGQGAGADQAREPDPGHHHPPELLPHVQEAGGHDGYGRDRGQRVRPHLRPGRGAHPHPPAHGPRGPRRPHLQDRGSQVQRRRRRHLRALRGRASRCWWARCRSRSPSACPGCSRSGACSTRCSTPSSTSGRA